MPGNKKIAILQSAYIPWKGYFDLIGAVDEFVIYDDMQYTRRDWRNRNQIKTPTGVQWLTVPVENKGKYLQKICETRLDGDAWREQHWKTLCQYYRRAPHFAAVAERIEPLYRQRSYTHLSQLNRTLLQQVCDMLELRTTISASMDLALIEGKTERLVDVCRQKQANVYISGPAARDYIDPALFEAAGIELQWFDYAGYPEYPQLWGPFVHQVSILDLLFNCGDAAPKYMKFAPT